ncbi:MAG: phosphoglucomutase/phosphomannomutase family protein [Candidatus Omnitrophica bacterium]|nr:phosphoglucomutase/phosphomannomutase family protein [Candidatus Omnitrophota bacterium]
MGEIKFGTDGFRAIIADDFTFDNVSRIGLALAGYLKKNKKKHVYKGVIVGYDWRFLSDKFAEKLADILSGCGIPVRLTKSAVPTPAISAYIIKNSLPCGVIITASHNPPEFNGLKIKNEFGASVEKEVTREIESLLKKGGSEKLRGKTAKIEKVEIIRPYLSLMKKYLNFELIRKSRFNVVVDAMHGTGAGIVENILKKTECSVKGIRANRDILFGGVNPEPIACNLEPLRDAVIKGKADIGIALDGDGDRIAAMCPDGTLINSHQAICLLLLHLIEHKKFTGKIVKSLTTTTLVDRIAEHYNLPLDIVPVGFKNIASKMITEDVLLGGEESGGIGFKGYMPERDGALSGLLLLEMMAYKSESILEIIDSMEKQFGKFVYKRRDLKVRLKKPIPALDNILGKKVTLIETYDGTKYTLADGSWLMLRASGTEPIIRIYAEAETKKHVCELIEFGCALI